MKYYENESRFNGLYSRDNLSNKIKDGAYVINLDKHSDIGTHWVALWVNINNVTYFDSFGVEHIPKEIKTFIKNKNVKTNIFRMQAYDSIMCGYFRIAFSDFMFKGKSLTEYQNLFSPNDFKKKWRCDFELFYEQYIFIKNGITLLKCKKHTENINPQVSSTSNGKFMILSKCAICNSKKSKFIKKQDEKGLSSKLGIKTPLSNVPVLGDILF